jgi:hypothetical protein
MRDDRLAYAQGGDGGERSKSVSDEPRLRHQPTEAPHSTPHFEARPLAHNMDEVGAFAGKPQTVFIVL